jgi:hypothetical protein
LAYVAVAAFWLLAPKSPEAHQAAPPVPVIHEVKVVPPVLEQLDALDLRPSAEGRTGEQEF